MDTVEVVMAIEEVWGTNHFIGKRQELIMMQEFSIEIPDKEADKILSGRLFP